VPDLAVAIAERVHAGKTLPRYPDVVPAARRLPCYDYRTVLWALAEHYGIAADHFLRLSS